MSLSGFNAATGCHDRREPVRGEERELFPPLDDMPPSRPEPRLAKDPTGDGWTITWSYPTGLVPLPCVHVMSLEMDRCERCGVLAEDLHRNGTPPKA